MLTRAETGSGVDGNLVPPLQFSINLEHFKYKVNYLKKPTQIRLWASSWGLRCEKNRDNCLSGLRRAPGCLEVDHSQHGGDRALSEGLLCKQRLQLHIVTQHFMGFTEWKVNIHIYIVRKTWLQCLYKSKLVPLESI